MKKHEANTGMELCDTGRQAELRNERKAAKLRIELLSDLCAGSGYSYAGVIDTDITADRFGFPYIPARRIKGCMREAAEMISAVLGKETIEGLFGRRGQKEGGSLVLGNAHLPEYREMTKEAAQNGFAKQFPRDEVLQLFTSVRAQTKMNKNGVAENNTLRFVRVLNKKSPVNGSENMVFWADVTYDRKYEEDLEKILKAVRMIGMNRNRGFGNVRCTLENKETVHINLPPAKMNGDGSVEISYQLENLTPLMISQGSDNISETCIPGRMILGALAARYLKLPGKKPEDPAFRNLFLNGDTVFLNAYIADSEGNRTLPAPMFIKKLKKTGKYVNVERIDQAPEDADDEYCVLGGNQPKKLSGKYYSLTGSGIEIIETDTQLTYHVRREHSERELTDSRLYSHLEITENQVFAGKIITKAAYADLLAGLLESGCLHLGKSRTAQYGQCEVKVLKQDSPDTKKIACKAGDYILVSLDSPCVIRRNGTEAADFRNVYRAVAEGLGISDKIDLGEASEAGENGTVEPDGYVLPHTGNITPYSMIDTKLLFGYQSVWNLRRTPVPAIAEGSTFVYLLKSDGTVPEKAMIGEMNVEGCGEVTVRQMTELPYRLSAKETGKRTAETRYDHLGEIIYQMDLKREIDRAEEEIQGEAEQRKLHSLSPAAVGRITLMLKDALKCKTDPKEQFADYRKRLTSIKKKSTGGNALAFAESWGPQRYEKLYSKSDSRLAKDMGACWGTILLQGLTYQKYLKKDGEADE